MMRVLAVTYCRAMLGANRAMLAMIKDMRERYHIAFTVLMPLVEDGKLAEVLEEEKIPYIIAPMKMWVYPVEVKYKKLRSRSAQIKTFFLSRSILNSIKKEKYDLIYTNNSTVQYGAIIAKNRRLPHVWHIRELGKHHYDFDYSYPYKKRIEYFRNADQVIAISEAVAAYAKNELCPGANIQRVYDGIEIKKTLKRAWNTTDPLRVVYVAALQPGKNQLELIYAVEKLIDQGINDLEVFLVGDGEEYRAELELYVAQHRLSRQIHFWGYREDIDDILDTMDVGVICSKSEGFGLVTCEYMAASLPVIGADSGATSELISHQETGFLYSAGDVNMLADRIKTFCSNRELIRTMGTNGYYKVKECFDRKVNTNEMYAVFTRAISLKKTEII